MQTQRVGRQLPCQGDGRYQRQPAFATAAAGSRCPTPAMQRRQRLVGPHSRAGKVAARAATVPEPVAAELDPAGLEQWAACAELVQQRCGLDADAADTALLRAFGWKGQGFWRQERVKEVPSQEQVDAALDFLAGLGIAEGDLGPLVRTFPEALGLRVALMQDTVQVLRDTWHMKGSVLVNSIKRKPRVLGNCIDCEVGAEIPLVKRDTSSCSR